MTLSGSQADQLAEANAGVGEEPDDELVAFAGGTVFDSFNFPPGKHINELVMGSREQATENLVSLESNVTTFYTDCPGLICRVPDSVAAGSNPPAGTGL